MPKGQGTLSKSLGKQEMDPKYKAMAGLVEAMEQSKLCKGADKAEDTHSGLSDGDPYCGERFAI